MTVKLLKSLLHTASFTRTDRAYDPGKDKEIKGLNTLLTEPSSLKERRLALLRSLLWMNSKALQLRFSAA